MSDETKTIEEPELTPEQEKNLRKRIRRANFRHTMKMIGIGVGGAVLGAVPSFLVGRMLGRLDAFKTEGFRNLQNNAKADAINDTMNYIYDQASTGNLASEFTLDDGTKSYLTYNVSKDIPAWWNNPTAQDVSFKKEVIGG